MRLVYTVAIRLYALAVKLASPFHRKARLTADGQAETLRTLRRHIDPSARWIWFHAASLGEFEQGRPVMEALRRRYPHHRILLTFFSPSGYEVRKGYAGADLICYLPFDTPGRVRRFLDAARPAIAIFIKYEFWLNYLIELHRRRIPTYIISAIFRPDQLFFKPYGRWYRRALHSFDRLFVQDADSAGLLAGIGVAPVTVTGDTRFDRVVDVCRQARPLPAVEPFVADGRFVLVAGSTWPPDEAAIIPYFNRHPALKLIIAPHEIHEAHLAHIEAMLQRPFVRLSQAGERDAATAHCLIVDSFGQLSSIYRYGQAAYIGGGFGRGIHNTLEAAVYGVPVLFGPNYDKFREARELIAVGGGFALPDAAAFDAWMERSMADPALCRAAGAAAGRYVADSSGATATIVDALDHRLKQL